MAGGRDRDALAAFLAVERVAGHLDAPNLVIPRARAMQMFILVRLSDTERAEQTLARLGERAREREDVHVETAVLLLAPGVCGLPCRGERRVIAQCRTGVAGCHWPASAWTPVWSVSAPR
ncbi:MAG: hypothetical protein ACRDN0_02365 [Trebonia sp.]